MAADMDISCSITHYQCHLAVSTEAVLLTLLYRIFRIQLHLYEVCKEVARQITGLFVISTYVTVSSTLYSRYPSLYVYAIVHGLIPALSL